MINGMERISGMSELRKDLDGWMDAMYAWFLEWGIEEGRKDGSKEVTGREQERRIRVVISLGGQYVHVYTYKHGSKQTRKTTQPQTRRQAMTRMSCKGPKFHKK